MSGLTADYDDHNYIMFMLEDARKNRRECQEALAKLRQEYYHKPWYERFCDKVMRLGFPMRKDYKLYGSAYLRLTREWGRRIKLLEQILEIDAQLTQGEQNAQKEL